MLRRRSKISNYREVKLSIVVCSRFGIRTNLDLSPTELERLRNRTDFVFDLYEKVVELYPEFSVRDDEELIQRKIKEMTKSFDDIKLENWTTDLYPEVLINREDFEKWNHQGENPDFNIIKELLRAKSDNPRVFRTRKTNDKNLTYKEMESLVFTKDKDRVRRDNKPISVLPLCFVRTNAAFKRTSPYNNLTGNILETEAANTFLDSEEFLKEMQSKHLEEGLGAVKATTKWVMKEKRKGERLKPIPKKDPVLRKYIDFLREKGMKEEEYLDKLKKDRQKKIFDSDCSTKDIQDFIDNEEIWLEDDQWINNEVEDIQDLIANAKQMSESKSSIHMKSFLNTRMGKCLLFQKRLLYEISLTMKTYVPPGHLIIQKVPKTSVTMVMKSCGIDKPCWVKLFVPRDDLIYSAGAPFREWSLSEDRDFYHLDSFTVDKFKIDQWVNNFETLLGMSAWYHSLLSSDHLSIPKWSSPAIRRRLNFCVCHLLEAKPNTSANLNCIRYLYMEFIKVNSNHIKIVDKLKKFNPDHRSRFSVYVMNNVISASKKMLENQPCPDIPSRLLNTEDDPSFDSWLGLVSLALNDTITSAQVGLTECYLGCLFNKDQENGVHGEMKMMEKLIEEEISMATADLKKHRKISEFDWKKDHGHEFSSELTTLAANQVKKLITEESREPYEEWFHKELYRELSRHSLDSLGTLKASMNPSTIVDEVLDEKNLGYFKLLEDLVRKEDLKSLEMLEERTKNLNEAFDEAFEDLMDERVAKEKDRVGQERRKQKGTGIKHSKLSFKDSKKSRERLLFIERGKQRERLIGSLILSLERLDPNILKNPELLCKRLFDLKANVSNLFRKHQWGDTREIFVLHPIFRLNVFIVECMSKILGKMIPEEMLTRGKAKHQIYKDLVKESDKMEREQGLNSFTLNTAGDCTHWCQQFVMPVFGSVLAVLAPKPYWNYIINLLNAVSAKKIEIPSNVLRLFTLKPFEESFSENLNQLKNEFLGKSKTNPLVNPNKRWFKNRSNMMQGILHFTSSLLHAAILHLARNFLRQMLEEFSERGVLKKLFKTQTTPGSTYSKKYTEKSDDSSSESSDGVSKKDEGQILAISQVSSDDYSLGLTFLHKNKVEAKKGCYFYYLLFVDLVTFCHRLSCIKESPKTVDFLCSGTWEFNSVFKILRSEMCPMVPLIAAATKVQSTTRLDNIQHLCSNLRQELLNNGACFQMVDVIQESQAFSHYCTLGALFDSNFEEFKRMAKSMPHPLTGFFFLDPPEASGLGGLEFSTYVSSLGSPNFNRVQHTLLKNFGSEVSKEGHFHIRVQVFQGDSKKAKDFKSKFLENVSVEDFYKQNPHVLFQKKPTNEEECKIFLREKMEEPGVEEHFHMETCLGKLTTSTMILSQPTLTISMDVGQLDEIAMTEKSFQELKNSLAKYRKKRADEGRPEPKRFRFKCSMLYLMRIVERTLVEPSESDVISERAMTMPLSSTWDQVMSIIKQKRGSQGRKQAAFYLKRNRQKPARDMIELNRTFNNLPVKIIPLLKWKWFGAECPSTKTLCDHTWETLKASYSWLRENFDTTLEESPFDSTVAFRNFFVRLDQERTKKVYILGPRLRAVSQIAFLIKVVENCQHPAFRWVSSSVELGDQARSNNLLQKLALQTIKPLSEKEKFENILIEADSILPEDLSEAKRRVINDPKTSTVAVMQRLLKDVPGSLDLISLCQGGVTSSFTNPGTIGKNRIWSDSILTVRIEDTLFQFQITSSVCYKVSTNKAGNIKRYLRLLKECLDEHKIQMMSKKDKQRSKYISPFDESRPQLNLAVGLVSQSNTGDSAPVFENFEIRTPEEIHKPHLVFAHGFLKLKSNIPNKSRQSEPERTYTVLSISLKEALGSLTQERTVEYTNPAETWKEFFNGRPASLGLLIRTLKGTKVSDSTRDWARENFKKIWSNTAEVNHFRNTYGSKENPANTSEDYQKKKKVNFNLSEFEAESQRLLDSMFDMDDLMSKEEEIMSKPEEEQALFFDAGKLFNLDEDDFYYNYLDEGEWQTQNILGVSKDRLLSDLTSEILVKMGFDLGLRKALERMQGGLGNGLTLLLTTDGELAPLGKILRDTLDLAEPRRERGNEIQSLLENLNEGGAAED
uniref:RNA-dependent RNA polymerase n=1 Tax=Hubei bunya-like virus 4 TaxID=1922849 RepID=A0A1L3KPT0_9VIRU|nr:RNA-dependent RNA polymerase [Hubei bunya-like virus 4]